MKKVVISLGGSVIVPNKVDFSYLRDFKTVIKEFSKGNKVVIVTGGGKTARNYLLPLQKARMPKRVASLVGIASTRLNARLVAGMFGVAENVPETLKDVKKMLKRRNLVVCGALGDREGMTSDGNAAEVAADIKADFFLNITNVKGLYDDDPKKKSAKLIREIGYEDFLKIIKRISYKAGQHFVLDQAAARIIKRKKVKVFIVGKGLRNIEKCLYGEKFLGTVIE
tara:strand:- start:6092 stop:6766 length:675 start_codon:yes stop_codon:yes gene_type:complete